MAHRPDPDTDELFNELLKVHPIAGSITHSGYKNILGYCSPAGRILVDERVCILSTLIHELIHRVRPRMSELAVLDLEKKLRRSLSQAELDRWWLAYTRLRKTVDSVRC